MSVDGASADPISVATLPGAISVLDTPTAGTYTYKLQMRMLNGGTGYVYYSKLVAYEL